MAEFVEPPHATFVAFLADIPLNDVNRRFLFTIGQGARERYVFIRRHKTNNRTPIEQGQFMIYHMTFNNLQQPEEEEEESGRKRNRGTYRAWKISRKREFHLKFSSHFPFDLYPYEVPT